MLVRCNSLLQFGFGMWKNYGKLSGVEGRQMGYAQTWWILDQISSDSRIHKNTWTLLACALCHHFSEHLVVLEDGLESMDELWFVLQSDFYVMTAVVRPSSGCRHSQRKYEAQYRQKSDHNACSKEYFRPGQFIFKTDAACADYHENRGN